MLRRIAFTAFLVALAGAATFRAAPAAASSGGIYVTTLPIAADVWVDGSYVGRSPVLVDALPAGHHTLTVSRTGWQVREVDCDVAADTIVFSSVRLAATPRTLAAESGGSFVLRGVAPGTHVELDGVALARKAGASPVPAPAGVHHLSVDTSHGRVSRSFTIYPGTTTDVVILDTPGAASISPVLAPAEDYLPDGSFSVEGTKIVVRYSGHEIVAHIGESALRFDGEVVSYAGVPSRIGGKLYLPLELLQKLTEESDRQK